MRAKFCSRSDGRVEKKGEVCDYETFPSMSGTILPTMCVDVSRGVFWLPGTPTPAMVF